MSLPHAELCAAARKKASPILRTLCVLTLQGSVNTSLPEKNPSIRFPRCSAIFSRTLCRSGLKATRTAWAASVGRSLGRIVYITDAADDAFRDIANGSYNPFAASLGSDICERREVYDLRGHRRVRGVLKRPAAEDVLCSASYIIRDLNAAAALADFSACPELRGIIENIILLGIPGELRQVLGLVPPADRGSRHETVKGLVL